ncbi:MAG: PD-(D/E)XK nuclease family protein [Candidatus Moraniibacteriota bacterium]|nr:MAG: PD-(D/E)XK nuclease family protein [Candidatus Moranbacteria bacterium]
MRLSYSSLGTYQTCPLKYKFKEINRLREPKSKEAVFGTLVHSTLKFFHEPALLPPSLEDALNHFSKNWNDAVYDNPDEERAAFSAGVDIIRRYAEHNDPKDFAIIALESPFQIEIADSTGTTHTIKGIIDRIDKTPTGYEIIDYKTGRKMPSQADVDHNLQLSVYAKAFLARYPKEAEHLESLTVSLYFLKHGVKLSSTRTAGDLQKVDDIFLETIQEIEAGHFEPRVNPLCDWCGFQKICPMWKHKFRELRTATTEEKEQAVNDYLATKRAIELDKQKLMKLQATILEYMDAEDVERLFGDAGIIERARTQKYDYDANKLRDYLEPLGKWESVLAVNQTLVKKTLASLPLETRTAIESEAKTIGKETTTLRVKKTLAEDTDE